jgi:Protein of unknown function (DUF1677)
VAPTKQKRRGTKNGCPPSPCGRRSGKLTSPSFTLTSLTCVPQVPTGEGAVNLPLRLLMEFLAKNYIETEPPLPKKSPEVESEQVKCVCCGLTEECTLEYIEKVRERYLGNWICGLCAEAVKDEIRRSRCRITTEEAIDRHISFLKKFRAVAPPVNPAEYLVAAVRKMMRRCLDSPRPARSPQCTPRCQKVVPQNYDEILDCTHGSGFSDISCHKTDAGWSMDCSTMAHEG